MRKRKIITVFAIMLAAVMPAALAGCSATVTDTNPPAPESTAESSTESSAESSAESSTEESSAAESSETTVVTESSADESSAAESSTEESSAAESSAAESSAAESSSSEGAKKVTVKFTKPSDWGDEIYVYAYLSAADKNADWPGEKMKKESDGTYSYELDDHFSSESGTMVIFNDTKNQVPKSGDGFIAKDGETYTIDTSR